MDSILQQTVFAAFKPVLVLLALPFVVEAVVSFVGSPRFRGWFAEKGPAATSLARLDPQHYHRLDGLEVPKPDGSGVTQIDHVVVSRFGIFVIETEEMAGSIAAAEKEPWWTVTAAGKPSRFDNPLWRNSVHVWALQEYLGWRVGVFHSVVFFSGECAFQTPTPPDVLTRGLVRFVESFQVPLLSGDEIERTLQRLGELESCPGAKSRPGGQAAPLAPSRAVGCKAA